MASEREGVEQRLPPQSREAERCVLGSMLRDNGIIGDVMQIIQHADAFYQDAHQKIFQGIVALYDKGHPSTSSPWPSGSASRSTSTTSAATQPSPNCGTPLPPPPTPNTMRASSATVPWSAT